MAGRSAGKSATGAVLTTLPAGRWVIQEDVTWSERRFATVGHVAIGPPGVFVIDTKSWRGRVSVVRNVLRRDGRSREHEVAALAEAARAVGLMIPSVAPDLVRPVLCFARDEELTGTTSEVLVCSTSTLLEALTSLPIALDVEQTTQLSLELEVAMSGAATEG